MRKWILAAIAVSVVFLGGCTTNDPSPTPTVTVTAEAPAPVVSVEDEYVYDVEMYSPNWSQYGTREDLVALGYLTCQAFRDGMTLEQYLTVGELPYDLLTTVAAASVVNFCPEFTNALEA
jgi:type IV pilus biogenesis protein CpaD/CtpE